MTNHMVCMQHDIFNPFFSLYDPWREMGLVEHRKNQFSRNDFPLRIFHILTSPGFRVCGLKTGKTLQQ